MPFKSKAQMRAAFGGYLGSEMKAKAKEFADATPHPDQLPEHVKDPKSMALLTTAQRNRLPDSSFVFPKERKYPIHDEAHARNALARVSRFGTPEEVAKVRSAVKQKYPNIK